VARELLFGVAVLALAACAHGGAMPVRISGIYPHLAVFNGAYDAATGNWDGTGGECGIGAVVPWAGKLWMITYPPHHTHGGPDKLWAIDKDLKIEMRPESVGGTHASRMIHRESNQLIIGPYFINADGVVRAADVKKSLAGRMTATARHLKDPENLVYMFDMEGAIYEVNVHTLAVKRLFQKPVPGWHGKGGYTGQGRFIIANNGERRTAKLPHLLVGGLPANRDEVGCLAEWDGATWRIVERKQFLDVTGPGGIHGNPDDKAPVWSIGWDRRSCILKLLDGGAWRTFRTPKASYSFDPTHGWYTEWPRIREIGGGKWMMDIHGMFYNFPPTFAAGKTGGIAPIASHLRYIPDFCDWNGSLILAADEASVMQNPKCGKSQSNIWFGKRDNLPGFGPRTGWGGPWVGDAVKAGEPSDPFLVAGFDTRCLHLSTGGRQEIASGVMRTADRFEVTELPAELAGLTRVAVSRGQYTEAAPGYAFTVDEDVTVFLAMDVRGAPDPGEGWTQTGLALQWRGAYSDVVYRKAFKKGNVTIPGRSDTHGAQKHYPLPNLCFVKPIVGAVKVTEVDPNGVVVAGSERLVLPPVDGVTFAIEVDRDGSGAWKPYVTVPMPASGYAYHLFPDDFKGVWARVTADRDCRGTAYFHQSAPRRSLPKEDAIFASLAKVGEPATFALVRPAAHNTRLQVVTETVYLEVDAAMAYHGAEKDRTKEVRDVLDVKADFTVDAASAIMMHKGRRYRLPKGDAAFDEPFAWGSPRGVREVQSERFLANIHGTFYEMPRDTRVPDLKPVCTHNRQIPDYCSWRGLLVLSGVRSGTQPDGNTFRSFDGRVGLWFGAVDDLWKLGKPVGKGGPWRETAVTAGARSDPYLMTGFDRKTVDLSHDAGGEVAFTIEVKFTPAGAWQTYQTVRAPAGETVQHVFPTGYSAHWVRIRADKACKATAWFVYE